MSQPDSIDHATLSAALTQARVGAGASDLHGSICGFLCGGGSDKDDWLSALPVSADELRASGRKLLEALLGYCRFQLDDTQMSFHPLLPDDEQPLARRAAALAEWCQGFLGGLGVAAPAASLEGEAAEIVADLAGIAATRFDFEAAGEEEETAYVELIEYVRMAALFLRAGGAAEVAPEETRH
jgi:uncharacterized protein